MEAFTDWSLWIRALLLAFMMEGAMMVIAPQIYKSRMVDAASHASAAAVRISGLVIMIICLLAASAGDWSVWMRALLLAFMMQGMVLFVAPQAYIKYMAGFVSKSSIANLRTSGFIVMLTCLFVASLA